MESSPADFKLKDIVVVCRSCGLAFATTALVEIPPITDHDQIEADLHRVLPNATVRSALIAVCPDCHYAAWTSTFRRIPLKVEIVPHSECPPTQKFALAVKTGRDNNMHALDLAFIALNGCWAAREAGEPADLWLELAAFEHARGLADNPLSPEEDGYGHLMMAEIWRQIKQFDRAVKHYDLALTDPTVPRDLILRQRSLAKNGNHQPALLSAAMVRQVFTAVTSPDVIYEEMEELAVPPLPKQKAHEKMAVALGVSAPPAKVSPAAVATAATAPLSSVPLASAPATAAPAPLSLVKPAASASPTAAPGLGAELVPPAAASNVTPLHADRTFFVSQSVPHTGNGTAGVHDQYDVYDDVVPAGKEQVVLPDSPGAAVHNKVDAHLHTHYFRRPTSPAAEKEPAGDDAWITDFDARKPAAGTQAASNEPENYESDEMERYYALAAANNAQALADEEAERQAFEQYQNQSINSYVASQSAAAQAPAALAPAMPTHTAAPAPVQTVASAPMRVAPPPMPTQPVLHPVLPEPPRTIAPAAAAPVYASPAATDEEDEFDDEFDEFEDDDIPIEEIIPNITLTGDVSSAPLRKKKRRRQRFPVAQPPALAPAVNYGAPPQPTYAAPMPTASYAMAAVSSQTYEPPAAAHQSAPPQQVQQAPPQPVHHTPPQPAHQAPQQPSQQAAQQPQAADTDESGGAQMDVSDAVARVESYLALSQQARRINWLRGYRGN